MTIAWELYFQAQGLAPAARCGQQDYAPKQPHVIVAKADENGHHEKPRRQLTGFCEDCWQHTHLPSPGGCPVDSPLVMALADFTDKDFEENYAPHLQRRQDWVILTPPLPHGTKKQAFLEQYGRKIATGQDKVYRERGWWMSGRDALASHATPLEGWVSKGQTGGFVEKMRGGEAFCLPGGLLKTLR